MGTTLNVRLSTSSIKNAIAEIDAYRNGLEEKCMLLRQRLIELGIETARFNSGEYTGMILFERQDVDSKTSVLVARDKQPIVRQWMYQGGIKSEEISPMLMAEFGSGWLAMVLSGVSGVGQGTFPGQTHAFDPHGWWWTTPDGEKHHSKGEQPSFPMNYAMMAMLREIQPIAKEVFQTNRVVKC